MNTSLPTEVDIDDRLVMQRLLIDDVDAVFAHFSDHRVTEYMDIDALKSRDEARDIIEWTIKLYENARGIRWAIRDKTTDDFLGTCGFNEIVTEHGSRAEVAYDLSYDFWGQGIMRSIMPRLLSIAFEDLGLHRVQATVTPGNERSARVLERHGFQLEGRLRGYGFWKGQFWDQDLYAILNT